MPIADVLLHPEYKHFKATDSVAILKLIMPIKSHYVIPACLPFKNYVMEKTKRQHPEKLFHVDFLNDVPRDFINEEKQVTHLHLLPRELCYLYDDPDNGTYLMKMRKACTTGCNFHSGAPTLVHEHTGHWTLVALSEGGSPCPDPLRPRRPPTPPRHILLFPYVPWITAAITGKAVGAFAKDDPFGYVMPRASIHDKHHEWVGHWWMGGLRCFDRGDASNDLFKFYHEIFQVKPTTPTYLMYHLEVFSNFYSTIICAKVGMPYRLGKPKVTDLDTPVIRVMIPTIAFQTTYRFIVEMWAYNTSDSSTDSDSTSETEESSEYNIS
ncbi:uncharacterized protein LOC132903418 [Amyelois transitella]|uniref:uncharacterized protein LOC132903418 n=1 Tax=Amyelois transitella TaxID=680683 RepID=UPI00298F774E|nr:uncharacterized protein LOC132903418 [Amyelois transitella]